MRVNVYAEEITDRIEIVEKDGFTGLRFYLELPVTTHTSLRGEYQHVAGPFIHKPGDDDSAAVTFWGKKDIRETFAKAIEMLDRYHNTKKVADGLAKPVCVDFYEGKCHSLTHMCGQCPDRDPLFAVTESDASLRSRLIRYAGKDLDASAHAAVGERLDELARRHGFSRMNTR